MTEIRKMLSRKTLSVVKWLLLMAAAIFLLIGSGGCSAPAKTSGGSSTAYKSTASESVESSTAKGAGESCSSGEEAGSTDAEEKAAIEEDGIYSSKDQVALYLHNYGKLPSNYITKSEAKSLGWVSSEGNLGKVAPGKSIGGDHFGNYEGKLPDANGRKYYECDIDYTGGTRNGKRIIYSNDGLIFYTGDHYNTFEQLY